MDGIDRISALPTEIKIAILCRLDLWYAVRTSALSSSWRHVWTLLPKLLLGNSPRGNSEVELRRFDQILSSHRGPLLDFKLGVEADNIEQSAYFQRFLDTIYEKGALHTLHITNIGKMVEFRLPQFNFLKELDLFRCSVALPEDFKGFKCLITLGLTAVSVSENDLDLLVNGSMNLTYARLTLRPTEPISVTVCSPSLTELQIMISEFVRSVKVGFAPCLKQVHIVGPDSNSKDIAGTTLRFMASIASVHSLSLNHYILRCLCFHDMPAACPFRVHFQQLKRLILSWQFSNKDRKMYNTFCSLLKSMPSIERLEIKIYPDNKIRVEPILWDECKKQDGFYCLDQTLESVCIVVGSVDFAVGMWMPHFLLVNANMLKLMEIKILRCTKEKLKMMEELHQIKPVSPDAKLIIGPYDPCE